LAEQLYSTASARLAATATLERPAASPYPVGGYSGVYFPDEEVTFHPTSAAPTESERPDQHRRRRSAGTLLAAILIIAGVAAYAGQGAVRSAISSLTSGDGIYSVNAAGTGHSGDLRRLLPAAAAQSRSCSTLLPGRDEQLNLSQESAIGKQPDIRKPMLKKLGYLRGAARCWVEPDGSLVAVDLLKFDTPDHAAEYHKTNMAGVTQVSGASGSLDGVGGVPGGMWFASKADAFVPGYTVVNGFAQRGDIVMVVGYAPTGATPRTSIAELARQQYGRL
jgi:hypothetical protein